MRRFREHVDRLVDDAPVVVGVGLDDVLVLEPVLAIEDAGDVLVQAELPVRGVGGEEDELDELGGVLSNDGT